MINADCSEHVDKKILDFLLQNFFHAYIPNFSVKCDGYCKIVLFAVFIFVYNEYESFDVSQTYALMYIIKLFLNAQRMSS